MRARLCLTLLLATPMAAYAFTLGGGGDARPLDPSQTFDFAANPATVAGTYLATQADGKLKGIKRVAITNFCVQFVYGKEAHAASDGAWVELRLHHRPSEHRLQAGLLAYQPMSRGGRTVVVGERSLNYRYEPTEVSLDLAEDVSDWLRRLTVSDDSLAASA